MPNKKKQVEIEEEVEEVVVIQPEEKTFTEEVKEVIEKVSSAVSGNCGHVNKQSFDINGKLKDVLCELPAGHAGDHSAKVKTLIKNPYQTKNPEVEYKWVEGAEYEIREVVTFWSDAGGRPASQIQPDYEGFANREEWVQARRAKQQKQQG